MERCHAATRSLVAGKGLWRRAPAKPTSCYRESFGCAGRPTRRPSLYGGLVAKRLLYTATVVFPDAVDRESVSHHRVAMYVGLMDACIALEMFVVP